MLAAPVEPPARAPGAFSRSYAMPDAELVQIPHVRAISDGLALICELSDGRRVGVPKAWIEHSSEVRNAGDLGMLVIPTHLAHDLGIVAPVLHASRPARV